MPIIWDIIMVALVLFFIVLSCRQGLIKTLFVLLGTLIALCGAIAFRGPVGEFIDKKYVQQPVENIVISTIADTADAAYDEVLENTDIKQAVEDMPPALTLLMDSAGVSKQSLLATLNSSDEMTYDLKVKAVESIAHPISRAISTAIAFIVLFAVLYILAWLLARVLSAICKLLPLGKKLDRFGGALAGAVKGIVIVMILSSVVWVISLGVEDGFFARETLEQTHLTKEIVRYSPISNIFKIGR